MKKNITFLFLLVASLINAQTSLFNGNNNYFVKPVLPSIGSATTSPSLNTPYSVNTGGNVVSDGGVVTERGLVWSLSSAPTISVTTKRSIGYGNGSFVCNINGLNPGTTYFARAYATNSAGTVYGSEISFSTATLPVSYKQHTVNIENQVWTDKNLEVSTYRNGDSIPFAKTVAEWTAFNNSGTGAYAYLLFANNEAGRTYGKLYNWYAVNDIRGLAPAGYHIPSTLEWTTLRNTQPTDGFTFRSTSNDWGAAFNNYNTGDLTITNRPSVSIGDNSTGFNVLPSGNMSSTGGNPITNAALFWTTDADAANPKNANWFYFTKDNIYNAATQIFTFDKGTGMSVRLVKD